MVRFVFFFLYFYFESTLCINVVRFLFIELLRIDHGSFLRPIIQAASTIDHLTLEKESGGSNVFLVNCCTRLSGTIK